MTTLEHRRMELPLPEGEEQQTTLPHEQHPAVSSEADSLADKTNDYRRRPASVASSLPSYGRATQHDTRTTNELERIASLEEFVEDKMYANDNFGGHKGVPQGPPNDPFKVFRWAKRKIGGEKGAVWKKLTMEERAKWEEQGGVPDEAKGEVVEGDVDAHTVL